MMTAERMRFLQDLGFGERVLVCGTFRVNAASRDGGVDFDGR